MQQTSATARHRAVFLFAFLTLLALMTRSAHAEIIERIVAIVNDDIVTLTDMGKYADRLRTGGLTDDLLIPDDEVRDEVLKDRAKLLQKMVDEKVIDSEVKRQNLTVPFERVDQEVRSIAKRNNISRDDLKTALTEKGINFSQYQDFIKTGLERQALIEKAITSKIKVSEDDVLAQLSNSAGSDQMFEYTLAHILLLADKGGMKSARERADFVLQKLKDGGNFEQLSADYSEDPNYTSGGMLGTFKSGEFLKEMEAAVQKISIGEISAPVQTKAGVHILKIVKKRLIPDPQLEKEKDKIRQVLFERAYKKQFQSWLEQIRQDAFIRINNQ